MLQSPEMKLPAPWRAKFMEHISDMSPPTFVLSTLHAVPPATTGSTTTMTTSFVPRARTVVFRGMWAGLPSSPQNPAPLNPAAFESDMPAFTTDARMDKADEITATAATATNSGSATAVMTTASSSSLPSGGGGPVEAVFWASKAKTQWRVRGRAYVLGPDIEDESGAARGLREALLARMRRIAGDGDGEGGGGGSGGDSAAPGSPPPPDASGAGGSDAGSETWSWAREITAHFGNMSPLMRGSFRNPPPGTPLSRRPDDDRLGLGHRVEDLEDPVARANFRVVVVVPTEVDRVDLSDPERGRRWTYRYLREGEPVDGRDGGRKEGEWLITELWP